MKSTRFVRIAAEPEIIKKKNILRKTSTSVNEINQSWRRLYWSYSHLVTCGQMTTLMAFFSITATVELQIKEGYASSGLIIAFVTTTSILVAITVIVKIVSSTILPHIESVALTSTISDVHRSPHDQLFTVISLTCVLGQTFAPFLFCMDLILIAWIKFAHLSREAPMAVTAIMVPVQVTILFFGRVMYKRIRNFKDEHGLILAYGPNRRYSEIAETWDEESLISSCSEDSSLLFNSYCSTTSYGAVRHNLHNLSEIKVYSDMH